MNKNLDFMMSSVGKTLAALRSMNISAAVPIRKSSESMTKRGGQVTNSPPRRVQEFLQEHTVERVQSHHLAVAIAEVAKFRSQDFHSHIADSGTNMEAT